MENSYDTLIEKYPYLYKEIKCIECGIGWYKIIDKLSEKLSKIILEYSLEHRPYCTQAKEKYGSLRFYMAVEDDEMSDLISKAEDESEKTCEICGKEGKLHIRKGWHITRCEEHV